MAARFYESGIDDVGGTAETANWFSHFFKERVLNFYELLISRYIGEWQTKPTVCECKCHIPKGTSDACQADAGLCCPNAPSEGTNVT